MNNPYEQVGGFESGFSFESGNKKYLVKTGKTETLEGDKYRIGICEEGSDSDALPLEEHAGLNLEELKQQLGFLKELTDDGLTFEEIRKKWMDHAIDQNAEKNQKS